MKGVRARRFDYGFGRKLVTWEIYVNGNEEQERAIVAVLSELKTITVDPNARIANSFFDYSFVLFPTTNVLVAGTFR